MDVRVVADAFDSAIFGVEAERVEAGDGGEASDARVQGGFDESDFRSQ